MDPFGNGLDQRYSDAIHVIVGIDIGGANLKFASETKQAHACFFPMWRRPETLKDSLCQSLSLYRDISAIAVVMTGELADCFIDRAEGVFHIVDHTRNAASELGINACYFYGVDGLFREHVAAEDVDQVAAANWHALGSYVGQSITPNALLIDIGSTTTDIIPIRNGKVATNAQTDYDRLCEGSLAYVGCQRTPVCGLCSWVTYQGNRIPVMNEMFATIDDARIMLGFAPEDANDVETADGKARTKEFASNRLARMIGLDRRNVSLDQATDIAEQVMRAAQQQIAYSVQRLLSKMSFKPTIYVISGHGNDLLKIPREVEVITLTKQMGEEAARGAPSYAAAKQLRRFLESRSNHAS